MSYGIFNVISVFFRITASLRDGNSGAALAEFGENDALRAIAYLPEADGFLLNKTFQGLVLPSTYAGGTLTNYELVAAGHEMQYDAFSRRVLAVGASGTDSRLERGGLLTATGQYLAGYAWKNLQSSSSRVIHPTVVVSRDGQFATSYVSGDVAYLERVSVPVASLPGPRFSNARAYLDAPATGTSPGASFLVRGWTLDFGSTASDGIGVDAVHVYAFPSAGAAPMFLGADTVFDSREDIGAAFGPRFLTSEFRVSASGLPPGTYTIVPYAHSTISGAFAAGDATTITVASRPAMNLDNPASGRVTGHFTVRGWAADLGAGIGGPGMDGVHVYAFPAGGGAPQFLGASYGVARPDVGAVFGSSYASAGFELAVSGLAVGDYQIVAYAHSTVTGDFPISRSVSVTVAPPVSNPVMSLDGPAAGQQVSQPFVTGGWAIDLGASSGRGVDAIHVWAFPVVNNVVGQGRFVDQATLNGGRPDVAAVYGAQFQNSGFNFLMTGLTPGEYIIGVYVHSGVSGLFNPDNPGQTKFVRITVVQ